ncbi:hypothetical protein ACJIZ3_001595 [Penstemon smallii]|uniref:Replication factor A C-terminal domain-containing protein n=1 Tax=Penstemon smallii TaxID=265156 RepID=A0ABD3U773_9LAMI
MLLLRRGLNDIPEAQNLKTWRSNNLKIIVEMIAKDNFVHVDSSGMFPTENVLSLADVLSDTKTERFTVQVSVQITDLDQKYYYMACEKCFSGIDAELDYHYICLACKKPTIAKPREKIHVNIYDGSGHLDVTVFGPQAINIMQSDSDMCLEVFNKVIFFCLFM